MLHFFRNIRRSLLSNNNTGKYFKYAIGEVILVMVGILLALQVNNWNEERKEQQELLAIYETIKIDLNEDIETINDVLELIQPYAPYFEKLINKRVTYKDFKSDKAYKEILFGYPDLNFQNRGLNLLNHHSNSNTNNISELTSKIIRFYSKNLTEIKLGEKELEVDLTDNFIYWKNNESWYADLLAGISEDGYINYALNSFDYRNRVTRFYRLYYDVLVLQLQIYQKEAKEIINQIDNY
jgi:hypothetical protein